MEGRQKLKTLCETRWMSRADALRTFKNAYRVVVHALETLQENGDVKASDHLNAILQFQFIVTLVATEHILSNLVGLTAVLQAVDMDLLEAIEQTKVVMQIYQAERDDPLKYSTSRRKKEAEDVTEFSQHRPATAQHQCPSNPWKGKVRESNQQNLQRFEALQRQILQLGAENEKYKQCLQGPEKQVLVNTAVDEGEIETYKKRCNELSHQVYNFHEQNEQLMADLQQVNAHKVQIQMENNRLYEDNLALQKKMQSFLGDMNKTKFSLGALQDPSNTQYQYGKDSGEKESPEKEQTGSVPEKSDMEILALQAAAMGDRVLSAENAAEQTEMLRSQLQEEKSKTTKQSQTLTSRELEINRLQGKLGEQEQLIGHYKEQLDSQIANLTLEHQRQQDNLVQQLDHFKSGPKTRQQLEEINRLTAQTIAAEEAITFRDDQIKELKSEIARLKDDVDNTIPVLRAQLEVYQQDFEAERNARERQVEEKENIIAEMKNLEVKNQQVVPMFSTVHHPRAVTTNNSQSDPGINYKGVTKGNSSLVGLAQRAVAVVKTKRATRPVPSVEFTVPIWTHFRYMS
ncbi:OPTN-like protein [Mya arenaria]|uniref:OPTN-like protein n=1 Tax=Mya arenaria TaxID=6604 RepID=A0ABY7G043_MYAAR|nr:OPTN-like protein [Mya arenaria]